MSGPYIVVNEYNSPKPHTNITLYNASGVLIGTYGGNLDNLDNNIFNGFEGGVFYEHNPSRIPIQQTTFYLSQARFDALESLIQGQLLDTFSQTNAYYSLWGRNCVDQVFEWLNVANVSFDPTAVFSGTILDMYATARTWLTGNSWDYLYNEMLDENYGILDEVQEYFSDYWTALESLHRGETDSEVAENENDAVNNTVYSPIAIDLDSNGVSTTSFMHSSAVFDLNNDGIAEKTAWLDAGDGFLAVDLNENGMVDDGGELFGGATRGEGFAKLRLLDSNQDGFLSAADEMFAKLLVWQDANLNGVTEAGELESAAARGLDWVDLNYATWDSYDHGNLIGEHSSASLNGVAVAVDDVYFSAAIGQ